MTILYVPHIVTLPLTVVVVCREGLPSHHDHVMTQERFFVRLLSECITQLILCSDRKDIYLESFVGILTPKMMVDTIDVTGPWSHLWHVGDR